MVIGKEVFSTDEVAENVRFVDSAPAPAPAPSTAPTSFKPHSPTYLLFDTISETPGSDESSKGTVCQK